MTKIALIQINSQNDMAANLAKLESWIEQAATAGAKMIFTPENCLFMAANAEELHAHAAESHQAVSQLATLAKRLNIWLSLGSVATPSDHPSTQPPSPKLLNRQIIINPSGEIATEYDKIHLYQATIKGGESHDETRNYEAGNQAKALQTPIGKLGLTICYDLRFPQLFRSLAHSGAEAITVPSAFTHTTGTAHWHTLLRARAIENGCYIIAAAQTGHHPANRKTYGHSLIVNPWGKIIAEIATKTGILTAEIDPAETTKARNQLPSLTHDRDFS